MTPRPIILRAPDGLSLDVVAEFGERHAWEIISTIPRAVRGTKEIRARRGCSDPAYLAAALGREPTAEEITAYRAGFADRLEIAFDIAAAFES